MEITSCKKRDHEADFCIEARPPTKIYKFLLSLILHISNVCLAGIHEIAIEYLD